MADLPFTFSAPMVRGLVREIENPGTGKTQTRRILTPQPYSPESVVSVNQSAGKWMSCEPSPVTGGTRQMDPWRKLKCKPGDRLYVREHWRTALLHDKSKPADLPRETRIDYIADDLEDNERLHGRFRQAMHLPKWASRITLIVTDVRIERLQDISDADAIDEGIERLHHGFYPYGIATFMTTFVDGREVPAQCCIHARDSFMLLWESIHGREAWDKNPWVVAYTFEPVLGNIDHV